MFFTALTCALLAVVNCVDRDDLLKKYEELSLEEYVKYFNKQNLSWQAKVPEKEYSSGTILDYAAINKLPTANYEGYNLTKSGEFDARYKWTSCPSIGQVFDQGGCGSCWAYSTANMITDRICIHLGISVQISAQDFECCSNCFINNVCVGGSIGSAVVYWQSQGVVSANCKPYNIAMLLQGQCQRVCQSGVDYMSDKHYANSAYQVTAAEEYIKAEISKNGPIVAGIPIYSDFDAYSTGVYAPYGTDTGNGHALKVIGYGDENGIPYWLVVNTWGFNWGQNGIGKIQRNNPLLNFERGLVAGLPRN